MSFYLFPWGKIARTWEGDISGVNAMASIHRDRRASELFGRNPVHIVGFCAIGCAFIFVEMVERGWWAIAQPGSLRCYSAAQALNVWKPYRPSETTASLCNTLRQNCMNGARRLHIPFRHCHCGSLGPVLQVPVLVPLMVSCAISCLCTSAHHRGSWGGNGDCCAASTSCCRGWNRMDARATCCRSPR